MTRLRVLYLVPDLHGSPGGIARHGRMVCRALHAAGVDLTVLALHDAPSRVTSVSEAAYRPCDSRRFHFGQRALTAALSSPDVVLLEHPHFASLGLLAARLARAPLVVFGHGTDIWNPLAPVRRRALGQADLVLCVSRHTAERAIHSNRLDPHRIRVLYHCLDPDLIQRDEPEHEPSDLSLLTVSRISVAEQYKGHEAIIRSMPALLTSFPTLKYEIVGDGDGRPALQELAIRQGVDKAVRFHGFVSEEELASHYRRASIFAMPSWGEGFGIVFLEAMAHGKPVIAGNLDASAEAVRHGDTGLLVDPRDVSQVSAAISRLLTDAELRCRMGKCGAALVAREFSFDTFAEQLLGHLHDVTHRTGRSRKGPRAGEGMGE